MEPCGSQRFLSSRGVQVVWQRCWEERLVEGGLHLQEARAFLSPVQLKRPGGSSAPSLRSCPSNDGRRPERTWASGRRLPTSDCRTVQLGAPRTTTPREDSSRKHDFRLNAGCCFTFSAGICKAHSGFHIGSTLPPSARFVKYVEK